MKTVNDIIRDVRERAEIALRQDGDETVHHSAIGHMLRGFADRLDAAYKRDLHAMVTAGECDMRTAMDEVTRLREENEHLKEALRPVLGCDVLDCDQNVHAEIPAYATVVRCHNAVRKAKRIFSDGGAE